jgi:AraC family transcriptional regulator
MINPSPFSAIGMATSGAALVTAVENATITVARFGSEDPGHDVMKSLTEQDAYLLISPLQDLAQHDFWADGKHEYRALFRSNEFNILDLNASAACRIRGAFGYMQIHIPRRALDDLSQDLGTRPIGTLQITEGWKARDPVVAALKDCLSNAISQPDRAAQLFIDHVVLALRTHVARTYGGMLPAGRRMTGGLAPWQERRAKEFLAGDLVKNLTLQQVASECGLSVAHFSRAFKISAGATPHEWLQFRRIDRARTLLAENRQSLSEIALRCGYSDQSHFTRIFSRVVGVTPGAWRRLRISR